MAEKLPKLQIAGLLLLTVVLVVGLAPIAVYISIAGGSVNIPMLIWGLSIHRVHRRLPGGGTVFVLKRRRFWGRNIGPYLNDLGYESWGSMDYPLLPVSVEMYRRKR